MAGNQLTYNLNVDTRQAAQAVNDFFGSIEQGAAQAKSKLNTALGQGIKTSVEIEFKNGELIAKTVQNVNQESNKLQKAFNAVNGELGKTPAALKQQVTILKQLRDNTAKFKGSTEGVNKDWTTLTNRIKEAQAELNKMTKGGPIQQLSAAVTGLAGRFALVQVAASVATGVFSKIAQGASQFAQTGMELQVLTLQLEAFTGSTENANAAFKTFQQVAASTRFNVEEVAKAGQILLAYGVDTETAIEATKNLSVAASATGGDVSLLARNLGQAASQGRAYTRDLIQFAIQGIPIWDELAIVTGKSTAELKELAKEGKIGFDEVNQAIRNMTAEGSAFAIIAQEMDRTIIGQMAKLESGVQAVARALTTTFTEMDRAFGSPVIAMFDALTNSLNFIADNWRTIAKAIIATTAATIAYVTASNFGAIVAGLKAILNVQNIMKLAQIALNAAVVVFNALTGNWASIAVAIAAGTAAYVGMTAALGDTNTETEDALLTTEQLTAEMQRMGETGEKANQKVIDSLKAKKAELKEALDLQSQAQTAYNEEVEAAKGLKDQVKDLYKGKIDDIQTANEAIRDSIASEKDGYNSLKEALKSRYDDEKTALNEKLAKVREIYDLEIGALEAKTPAEQKLADLRRKELEEKARSTKLSEKEKLEAQAQLERMDRQVQIAALKTKKKEEEKKIQDQMNVLEKDYEDSVKGATEAHKSRLKGLEDQLKVNNEKIADYKKKQDEATKAIDDSIRKNKDQEVTLSNVNDLVRTQVQRINDAKSALDQATASARNLKNEWEAINRLSQNSTQKTSGNRASGGAVSGGSTYTVNELGKEAFLSASGKLSMINAPSWGSWKAPGAGTVIPAHITSQLSIPAGGVQVNGGANVSASRAGSGPSMAGMMKALLAASTGDNIQNNVTIQAANTTQAASDMLVSLTRIKRRRY